MCSVYSLMISALCCFVVDGVLWKWLPCNCKILQISWRRIWQETHSRNSLKLRNASTSPNQRKIRDPNPKKENSIDGHIWKCSATWANLACSRPNILFSHFASPHNFLSIFVSRSHFAYLRLFLTKFRLLYMTHLQKTELYNCVTLDDVVSVE